MSYDIHLENAQGEHVVLDRPWHGRGGTYAVGGTTEAWFNITYNYAQFYQQQFGPKGIRSLYGHRAYDCIPILEEAIKNLGTDRHTDYWAATSGNAGAALADLLELCKLAPEAIVNGD